MFTGIIETLGEISSIQKEGDNLHLEITSEIASELKVDQSVSHNGICLTVVAINGSTYVVTVIKESIDKSNISSWKVEGYVNLERAMKLGSRLDGHIVQGHVDQTGECIQIEEANGSHYFTFKHDTSKGNITIEKGSITVNGVSLTVVNSKNGEFSVAIIPYTIEHTNFKFLQIGSLVNLEFDVVGKYVKRLSEGYF